MDLHLKDIEGVDIRPNYKQRMTVICEGVAAPQVLEQMDIEEVVSFFGEDKLLYVIGREYAMAYFDLGPEEEQ